MSGIGSWLWGTSQLDDAVDKATSELLPAGAEDIALNLEICDQIRSKSIPAKDAMRALKRRLNHKNPNVQNLALSLTDICIKNGGDLFLSEVASREFMDNLVSILKIPTLNNEVKNNILRLIQNWSIAFEGKPLLSYVGQIYKTLVNEGYKFPPKDLAIANSAMVDTQTAPEWIDSDVCLRCRTPFSFTNRKHHCRNCGQVFDQACSSKSMPLPHFGITTDVRVCDGCYSKMTRKADKTDKRNSINVHSPRHRSAQDLADAELQRAIQLSLAEANVTNGHARPGYVPSQPPSNWQYSEPPIVDRSSHPRANSNVDEVEDDPDLKAAIEASLREANAPRPSAPIAEPRVEESSHTRSAGSQSYTPGFASASTMPSIPTYDLEPLESDAILTFSQTIEQVEAQGGRDISRYPAVNELYDRANSLRPKLALSLDDAGRKEHMLSDMHDKLSQAVKLYDKLLTEQLAHPRWRSPQPIVNSHQQAKLNYGAANQWAPSAAAGYQSQPQSPQASYSDHQSYIPSQMPASPPQSQWQQPSVQQHVQPNQQYQTAQVITPSTFTPQQTSYIEPSQQYQPHATSSSPPVQSLPPVSFNPRQYQHSAPPPISATSSIPAQPSPQAQYATPPPPPAQQPQSSSLNRHKTVSYAPSVPPSNSHLVRSNTLTHIQPPQQQAPSPPSSLPQFPVAPTSAPQTFSLYGPSAPVGLPSTEERKEALLIDL